MTWDWVDMFVGFFVGVALMCPRKAGAKEAQR
jgi:hypothetical protein